jgi:CBS domain-containing protein
VNIEKFVKDFVIPLERYPHIREDQTLSEAIEQVLSFKWGVNEKLLRFSDLFVLNRDGLVAGKITLADILTALEPKLLQKDKKPIFEGPDTDSSNLAILWEDSFFKNCRERGAKPVKEIMSPLTTVLHGRDPLLKALYLMLRSGEQSLPVLDDGRIVGILRVEELFTITTGVCEL